MTRQRKTLARRRAVVVALLLTATGQLASPFFVFADDQGLRKVAVEPYGITVQVPEAWRLIERERDERAFVMALPQEEGAPGGIVACELGVAPENLEEYRRRHEATDKKAAANGDSPRRLVENRLSDVDADVHGKELSEEIGQQLVSTWRDEPIPGQVSYDVRARFIYAGTLFTFILQTDEAHYAAYRLDFLDMLTSAEFSPPETGLERMANRFWMQREFRFALQLPPDWRPAFGPKDQVLFFATGATHEVFTDNLLVLATAAKPLDLKKLKKDLPTEIREFDAQADVAACKIVPQGNGVALETVIHTQRGPFKLTILERRFQGLRRNYEVKFSCETAEYERTKDDLRKALDSFTEAGPEKPKRTAAYKERDPRIALEIQTSFNPQPKARTINAFDPTASSQLHTASQNTAERITSRMPRPLDVTTPVQCSQSRRSRCRISRTATAAIANAMTALP